MHRSVRPAGGEQQAKAPSIATIQAAALRRSTGTSGSAALGGLESTLSYGGMDALHSISSMMPLEASTSRDASRKQSSVSLGKSGSGILLQDASDGGSTRFNSSSASSPRKLSTVAFEYSVRRRSSITNVTKGNPPSLTLTTQRREGASMTSFVPAPPAVHEEPPPSATSTQQNGETEASGPRFMSVATRYRRPVKSPVLKDDSSDVSPRAPQDFSARSPPQTSLTSMQRTLPSPNRRRGSMFPAPPATAAQHAAQRGGGADTTNQPTSSRAVGASIQNAKERRNRILKRDSIVMIYEDDDDEMGLLGAGGVGGDEEQPLPREADHQVMLRQLTSKNLTNAVLTTLSMKLTGKINKSPLTVVQLRKRLAASMLHDFLQSNPPLQSAVALVGTHIDNDWVKKLLKRMPPGRSKMLAGGDPGLPLLVEWVVSVGQQPSVIPEVYQLIEKRKLQAQQHSNTRKSMAHAVAPHQNTSTSNSVSERGLLTSGSDRELFLPPKISIGGGGLLRGSWTGAVQHQLLDDSELEDPSTEDPSCSIAAVDEEQIVHPPRPLMKAYDSREEARRRRSLGLKLEGFTFGEDNSNDSPQRTPTPRRNHQPSPLVATEVVGGLLSATQSGPGGPGAKGGGRNLSVALRSPMMTESVGNQLRTPTATVQFSCFTPTAANGNSKRNSVANRKFSLFGEAPTIHSSDEDSSDDEADWPRGGGVKSPPPETAQRSQKAGKGSSAAEPFQDVDDDDLRQDDERRRRIETEEEGVLLDAVRPCAAPIGVKQTLAETLAFHRGRCGTAAEKVEPLDHVGESNPGTPRSFSKGRNRGQRSPRASPVNLSFQLLQIRRTTPPLQNADTASNGIKSPASLQLDDTAKRSSIEPRLADETPPQVQLGSTRAVDVDQFIANLALEIASASELRSLTVHHTPLNHRHVVRLTFGVVAKMQPGHLQRLCLRFCELDTQTIAPLMAWLALDSESGASKSLHTLDLSDNLISAKDLPLISIAVCGCPSLVRISLRGNPLRHYFDEMNTIITEAYEKQCYIIQQERARKHEEMVAGRLQAAAEALGSKKANPHAVRLASMSFAGGNPLQQQQHLMMNSMSSVAVGSSPKFATTVAAGANGMPPPPVNPETPPHQFIAQFMTSIHQIEFLDFGFCGLDDSCVVKICNFLHDNECRLRFLILDGANVTVSVSALLLDTIKRHCRSMLFLSVRFVFFCSGSQFLKRMCRILRRRLWRALREEERQSSWNAKSVSNSSNNSFGHPAKSKDGKGKSGALGSDEYHHPHSVAVPHDMARRETLQGGAPLQRYGSDDAFTPPIMATIFESHTTDSTSVSFERPCSTASTVKPPPITTPTISFQVPSSPGVKPPPLSAELVQALPPLRPLYMQLRALERWCDNRTEMKSVYLGLTSTNVQKHDRQRAGGGGPEGKTSTGKLQVGHFSQPFTGAVKTELKGEQERKEQERLELVRAGLPPPLPSALQTPSDIKGLMAELSPKHRRSTATSLAGFFSSGKTPLHLDHLGSDADEEEEDHESNQSSETAAVRSPGAGSVTRSPAPPHFTYTPEPQVNISAVETLGTHGKENTLPPLQPRADNSIASPTGPSQSGGRQQNAVVFLAEVARADQNTPTNPTGSDEAGLLSPPSSATSGSSKSKSSRSASFKRRQVVEAVTQTPPLPKLKQKVKNVFDVPNHLSVIVPVRRPLPMTKKGSAITATLVGEQTLQPHFSSMTMLRRDSSTSSGVVPFDDSDDVEEGGEFTENSETTVSSGYRFSSSSSSDESELSSDEPDEIDGDPMDLLDEDADVGVVDDWGGWNLTGLKRGYAPYSTNDPSLIVTSAAAKRRRAQLLQKKTSVRDRGPTF